MHYPSEMIMVHPFSFSIVIFISLFAGYFTIGFTEWVNEPRNEKVANIKFRKEYDRKTYKPILFWHVLRDIAMGEEVLAEYGGK